MDKETQNPIIIIPEPDPAIGHDKADLLVIPEWPDPAIGHDKADLLVIPEWPDPTKNPEGSDSAVLLPGGTKKIYSKEQNKELPFPDDPYALMPEEQAAAFLYLTRRALQNYRLTGNGPKFVRLSSRCIRYRKVDLICWQEQNLKSSTSEE